MIFEIAAAQAEYTTWELLKQKIVDELPYHEAKLTQTSEYGDSYVVDLPVEGPNGNTAKVRTAWMFKKGTDYPSLTLPSSFFPRESKACWRRRKPIS